MMESKLSNRDSSLDVNIFSDLLSSNMKTVDNLTQILRVINKTIWTVFVKKKLDQYHNIDKKNYHLPLCRPCHYANSSTFRIRVHCCWKTTRILLGGSHHLVCTIICQ